MHLLVGSFTVFIDAAGEKKKKVVKVEKEKGKAKTSADLHYTYYARYRHVPICLN